MYMRGVGMAVVRILIFLNSFYNIKDKKATDFLKKAIKTEYSLLIQQILAKCIKQKENMGSFQYMWKDASWLHQKWLLIFLQYLLPFLPQCS